MSDRIAVVNHGRIMQLATPRELYDRPANRFVADFIGESTFLKVSKTSSGVDYYGMDLLHENDVPDSDNLLLMVRPERAVLSREGPREGVNNFSVTATEVVYQGDSFLLHANLVSGDQIVLRCPMRGENVTSPPIVGDTLTISLTPADTVLIDGREA